MTNKPTPTTSLAAKELDKAEKQFDRFDQEIKDMTLDRMNAAPQKEVEPQTKLSQNELANTKNIYLKPRRSVGSREKFNEDYRKEYEFMLEIVPFIAENKEVIGESVELWTKPFAGMPAQEWVVPVNKPVWGPRHLAERLSGCKYHRFIMQNTSTGADGMAQYYGSMAVDTVVNRVDAQPYTERKSIFMGAKTF